METNAKMRLLLSQLSEKMVNASIPHKLLLLLNKGLERENDCVFLSSLKNTVVKDAMSHFGDKTGYECFINKIHIDDYVEEDYLLNGILFLREILIINSRKHHLKLILSINEESCVVRFHVVRENEVPWLASDLEGYLEEALLVFDSKRCEDYRFLRIDIQKNSGDC